MHLYRNAVAYVTGAEIMRRDRSWMRQDNLNDSVLHLFGQRLLEQFVDAGLYKVVRDLHNKQADNKSGYRVEDSPCRPEEYCATDADQCAYRRESIASMMPCIGNDNLRSCLNFLEK